MKSHLTAFGLGAGLVLLAAGVLTVVGPRFIEIDDDDDGVSVVNFDDGDSGSFQLKEGGLALAAKWKGVFEFSADARSLTALDRSLEVEVKDGSVLRRAVFEAADGKVKVSAFENDQPISGAAGDAEAAELLQLFARSSGVNAEQRLKAIIASGGKTAAVTEIGALTSGHAAGAYISALAQLATLDDADIANLSQRVAVQKSDYAKRRALTALLEHQKLSDAGLQEVLAAAKTIGGDHEVRLIVEALAENKMSPVNAAAVTALLADIESDHEVRLAAEALIQGKALKPTDAAQAAATSLAAIEGDYEKRLVIEAAAERLHDDVMAAALIEGADGIRGAHERRLAIEKISENISEASAFWPALIALVKGVDGDHERRLAVEALASHAPKTAELRAVLGEVAASISSDHDRRLAEDALN